jgi:3-deoxy-D-manno-octulosonate 8-phosphate phosphatase (KDO 8-P phosphatase)
MTATLLLPDPLRALAAGIRLACFDVDGTLTDGRLHYGADGLEGKAFHVHDGQGLKLLLQAGIEVALISARRSIAVERRAADLGIERNLAGVADKGQALRALCAESGFAPAQASMMGDDLPDWPALSIAGLSAAPADAVAWIAERVHWRIPRPGGRGAVRCFCDGLLLARGLDPLALLGAGRG